ncbi:signal peptidase I [Pseudoclavibacter helvolus]|uniref:signal peptidase I n=1 Tax=Pseudoclavibacter helvolus TaxID=255205 RepID=UPI0024AC9AAA|nr:signal peptidase I [Pseudoclavibacter helvolus]
MSDAELAGTPAKRAPRSRLRRVTSHPLFHLVAAFAVLALVQAFFVKVYAIPSASMDDTLAVGDRILVNRLAYLGDSEPATGDLVVFAASDTWDEAPPQPPSAPLRFAARVVGEVFGIGQGFSHILVKRVIATGGQSMAVDPATGGIVVDGVALDESAYVDLDFEFVPGTLDCSTSPASLRCFDEFTVPEGQIVVLGDNRTNSSDSLAACRGGGVDASCLRTVRDDDVVGEVFSIVWPLPRFGGV